MVKSSLHGVRRRASAWPLFGLSLLPLIAVGVPAQAAWAAGPAPGFSGGAASVALAVALPTAGSVVAGAATITQPSLNALTVSQSSGKAIVDWGSFSIGSGGTVRFDNGTGATLNRVTGAGLSSIDGLLSASGSVYLLNPNGVVIGRTGVVDVGGRFVASTLNLTDDAFLKGGELTFTGPSTASVVNLGRVGSLGGDVALIAATVSNAGEISAAQGSAGLLAGSRVLVRDAALDGGRFAVLVGGAGTSATNSGTIQAATTELRANGGDVYALAGDTAGVIRATGVTSTDGRVFLTAEGGTTHVAGVLEAQGAAGTAGAIETSGTTLDIGAASVDAHGGTWLLDPTNLDITPTAATSISNALATSDVLEQTTNGAPIGIGNPGLYMGDINLQSGAAISWSSTHALTLSAYRNVNLLGTITLTGAGALTLRADNAAGDIGTVLVTGAAGQVTLASGATANIYYDANSFTDTATRSTQQNQGSPSGDFNNLTNPYTNPYNASSPGQTIAASAPVMGGTVRAYMLVDSISLLGGGLTGVGSQLNGLYALNTDIDASSTKTANPVPGMSGMFYGFIPIGYTGTGNQTNGFTGVFDGQGHTISNLYVNHFTLDSNNNKQNVDTGGLFGYLAGNSAAVSIVRNLNVLNASVIGSGIQNGIIAGDFVGNAVGSNLVTSGTVNGPRSGGIAGQLENGQVQNSHSSATISNGFNNGGLVGLNGGSISGSYATGAVSGSSTVGGLVGGGFGAVTNSYATGAVSGTDHVGGLGGQLGTASNVYATGTVTATGGGDSRVGGLVGELGSGSTLTNAYATGAVTAQGDNVGGLIGLAGQTVTINGVYATGSVITAGSSVGGLIGQLQPAANGGAASVNLSNSFATGSVTSTANGNVGGLIGTSFADTITTSYASGAVKGTGSVGGLIGATTDYGNGARGTTVSDSYATGSVTGTDTNKGNAASDYLGGLIGHESHDDPTAGATTTVNRTYATGLVSGQGVAGGLIGGNIGVVTSDIWDRTSTGQAQGIGATLAAPPTNPNNPPVVSVVNLTSVQDDDPAGRTNGIFDYAFISTPYTNAGFQFGTTPGGLAATANQPAQTWGQIDNDGTVNGANGAAINTRPILLTEYATNISNAHQLELINLALAAKYNLIADIDASATAGTAGIFGPGGFAPIGNVGGNATSFTGSLDGQGHTISGLTEHQGGLLTAGLFGTVGVNQATTNSVITDLKLTGVSIGGTGDAGALAGSAIATINNVTAAGFVLGQAAGGLVGSDNGALTNSSAAVSVKSVAGGTANINTVAGGLVGLSLGSIGNSFATGAVSGGSNTGGLVGVAVGGTGSGITGSYATGAVGGTDFVGGLVGSSTANITNSYAKGSVTASGANVGGLAGLLGFADYNGGQYATTTSQDSYATGAVMGASRVGGLVGTAFGLSRIVGTTANLSYATGAVTAAAGATFDFGGLVGIGEGSITNSYATGPVSGPGSVGGLAGVLGFDSVSTRGTVYHGSAVNAYATGTVTATADRAGGLVGFNNGGAVADSFATGMVSGVNQVGGLVGANLNDSTTTQGTTYTASITGSTAGKTYASGTVTGKGTATGGLVGENQGTITLASYTPTGAGVTGVTSTGGLVGRLDAGATITGGSSTGAVTGTQAGTGGLVGLSLGAITGSFAGGAVNGAADTGGLVGLAVGGTGTGISGSYATGAVAGTFEVGGLVGGSTANITGSYAKGAVTATTGSAGGLAGDLGFVSYNGGQYAPTTSQDSYATGNVVGVGSVGGLVGYGFEATIVGTAANLSYATGAVSTTANAATGPNIGQGGLVGVANGDTITNSYATGAVSGNGFVGGLVGDASFGTATGSGGATTFQFTSVSGSHATGAVTASGSASAAGGLVGDNQSSMVADSYATGNVAGVNQTGGLVGINQQAGASNVSAGTPTPPNGYPVPSITGSAAGKTYASGTVTGTGTATGGLVGENQGTISAASYQPTGAGVVGAGAYTGGLVGLNDAGAGIAGSAANAVVSGTSFTGGLVGSNYGGSITGSFALGSVRGTDGVGGLVGVSANGPVSDSYSTDAVTGRNQVGGLVGSNAGPGATITGSAAGKTYASGSVTGTGTGTGGLVGENQGTITLAGYTGAGVTGAADVGGAVGLNDAGGALSFVSAYSPVFGTSYTGGVVGDNFGSLTNANFKGAVSGASGVGGLVGVNEGGATIGGTYVGGDGATTVVGTGNDVGGAVGANFGTIGDSRTYFISNVQVTGVDHVGGLVGYNSGAVFGANGISSVSGRDYVGGQIGLNFGTLTTYQDSAGNVTGRNYVGGVAGWNDSAGFVSTNAASGLKTAVVATGDYVGGVAGVNKGTLTGVRASGGSVTGGKLVGGLVGLNQGSISASSSSDSATGDQDVGGLVGWNDTGATISKSYATGRVTGRVGGEDATTRDDYVGGLIGVNFGSASDVYATGAVSGVQVVGGLVGTNMSGGGSITNAYATGAVNGTRGAIGGFAGVQAGTLTSVYFQPTLSGQSSGSGYATAQATGAPTAIGAGVTCAQGTSCDPNAQATYVGFDFANTWQSNSAAPPTLKGVTR